MTLPKETILVALKHLDTGNPFEQRDAKEILQQFNEAELFKFLVQLVLVQDPATTLIMRALPLLNPEKGILVLAQLTRHPDAKIRRDVCGVLGNHDNPKGIPALIERLDDEAGSVREVAIFSLSKMGNDSAIPKLQQLTTQDGWKDDEGRSNKESAKVAIIEIEKRHPKENSLTFPEILRHLPSPLGFGANHQAVRKLMTLARETSLDLLELFLRDPDPHTRADAAEAYVRLENAAALPKVVPLLQDEAPLVRWHVYGIFYGWGDKQFLAYFRNAALTDTEPNVRAVAILGLGKFGTLEMIPVLEKIQQQDNGVDDYDWSLASLAAFAIDQLRERQPQS